MQGYPGMPMNRPGLGLRPPMPSYGQGPSMMTLAQRQQAPPPMRPAQEGVTLFVGSIAGGITDSFLQQLLGVCFLHSCNTRVPALTVSYAPVREFTDMRNVTVVQATYHTREQASGVRFCHF